MTGIEEKTTRLAFLKQELEQMSKDITKTLNCKETVSMEIQQALQYIEQNQQSKSYFIVCYTLFVLQ